MMPDWVVSREYLTPPGAPCPLSTDFSQHKANLTIQCCSYIWLCEIAHLQLRTIAVLQLNLHINPFICAALSEALNIKIQHSDVIPIKTPSARPQIKACHPLRRSQRSTFRASSRAFCNVLQRALYPNLCWCSCYPQIGWHKKSCCTWPFVTEMTWCHFNLTEEIFQSKPNKDFSFA